ncbi:hypothetical protein GCM10022279_30770 [Comamonas faecalis]|uniref:Uncharacterized protein n=1 Tax=Comamonas faecalis TaxID=1387849 RepID=A0ABP7S043_9BURK
MFELVIPAKAGIQCFWEEVMDSGLRRNDEKLLLQRAESIGMRGSPGSAGVSPAPHRGEGAAPTLGWGVRWGCVEAHWECRHPAGTHRGEGAAPTRDFAAHGRSPRIKTSVGRINKNAMAALRYRGASVNT